MRFSPRRFIPLLALAFTLAAPVTAHADAFEDEMVSVNAANTAMAIGMAAGANKGTTSDVAPRKASDAQACVPVAAQAQDKQWSKDDIKAFCLIGFYFLLLFIVLAYMSVTIG